MCFQFHCPEKGGGKIDCSCLFADEGGNNVLLKEMILAVDGRPDVILDLTGYDYLLVYLRKRVFTLEKGCVLGLICSMSCF